MNTDIFLACVGIFIGELYGNFVGGGSLVTQIFLQNILGFDIKNAIALDNAAVLGSELGLLIMLLRKQKIEKWMWSLVVVSSLGALSGALLLDIVPTEIMKIIFTGAIVIIVIKNLFFSSKKASEKGFILSYKNIAILCVATFFLGMYNAFLSIGDFIVGLIILTSVFHFKYHKALFILCFGFVFARAIATLEYLHLGLVDMDFYLPMFVSAGISGLIAGYLVEHIHSDILNTILKYLSIVLAGYLIIQLLY